MILKVSEIFHSVQGESSRAGFVCGFVRLAGCNLRCRWCDTPQAQDFASGADMALDAVLDRVRTSGLSRWEITGGEPLAQPGASALIAALCDLGLEVLVETNGSLDIDLADVRSKRIVDVKGPSSGEAGSFLGSNWTRLTPRDELKFVVADAEDYRFARDAIRRPLPAGLIVNLSPAWLPKLGADQGLPPAQLVEWTLADRDLWGPEVRLNLQLHKIIWGPDAQGV